MSTSAPEIATQMPARSPGISLKFRPGRRSSDGVSRGGFRPCRKSGGGCFLLRSASGPMPIYEYECRGCGHQFELIVLKDTVIACPSCHGKELERLLSGFAVSSESTRQSNLQAARKRFANSSDLKDKKVAEVED